MEHPFFLNGLRGLMCFPVTNTKVCVFNPATRQLLMLPDIRPDIIAEQGQLNNTRFYIGHDPVNDHYKLFCTFVISSETFQNINSEHWVFQLEAGGRSWKKIVPGDNYHPHVPSRLGRSINGSVIHYMAWLDIHTCAVVSYDIKSEELTTIPVPQGATDVPLTVDMMKAGLVEYGGKIAVFDHTYMKDHGLVDLWVLEDARNKEWSKKSLVLQPCQRHLVHGIELVVKGSTQDGKVFLAPWKMRSKLDIMFYDIQLNDLRNIKIKGVPQLWIDKHCHCDLKFMEDSESTFCFKYL